MDNIIAIKIHYDSRADLADYRKYAREATRPEHVKYLDQYETRHTGGNGFHECLNFDTRSPDGLVRVYLPPKYRPTRADRDLMIFSFTYAADGALPGRIIGIHAGASLVSGGTTKRTDTKRMRGIDPLVFDAIAPADLTTLFIPPLLSRPQHLPELKKWGNGVRYLGATHAISIISDALTNASSALSRSKNGARRNAIAREITVLERIRETYLGGQTAQPGISTRTGRRSSLDGTSGANAPTDREFEYWVKGKRHVEPLHTRLQQRFEAYLKQRGYQPRPNHGYVDVQYVRDGKRVLCEIKPTEKVQTRYAIRVAIGQLLEYRFKCNDSDCRLEIVLGSRPKPTEAEFVRSLDLELTYYDASRRTFMKA